MLVNLVLRMSLDAKDNRGRDKLILILNGWRQ